MNKEDVLKLIQELNEKQTETICIEAKTAKDGKPEKYYDTVSSFSNTIGGTILFGVQENKTKNKTEFIPVGVFDTNELQKHITNLCSTEFIPVVRPRISVVDIHGKNIVAVEIDMLNQINKPCYYKPKGLHNGSYIRVGDRDDHMTEYEIYKCISYKDNVEDDLRAVTRATIEDLDQNLLDKFIERYTEGRPNFSKYSRERILLKAGILTKVEDKIFPTVAGVLVFGEYPQEFFPQWFVAAIVVPGFEIAKLGKVGERFIDNKRIEGNISQMYNATIGFLKRNMKIGMRLNPNTGLREDLPEYPIDALREAISNLLLHRDLSQYKESVYSKVIVYKDRIVFRNVGSLYGNNTIENIKNSEYNVEVRNETLVRLIETLGGVIENRHTGIKTMIDEMKQANLPEPIFNNEREDFVVTFYNGEFPKLYPEELEKYKKEQEKTYEKTYENVEEKILEFCIEAKSAKEIAEHCGYKGIDRFKRNYLKPLLENGKIIMTIPDKPKSKNQKYIVNNGIGDYTKEKYENPEEFTIEDFEKYMAENR